MHIRFSSCIGLPVAEEESQYALGDISGILLHPDTGKVEGFLVRVGGFSGGHDLFCSSADILRWGTRVHVRSADVLAPAQERIRLQPLLSDPRTVLGQKIRTESGTYLGVCKDVQFNTDSMQIEWLFPKKWFRWGVALPVSEVLEIRADAIIVRDIIKQAPIPARKKQKTAPVLPDMETGMVRKA